MSSFDSIKKTINDLFSWSDNPQQPNKIQTKSQNPQPINQNLQNKKATKSQHLSPYNKNETNPEITPQKKPDQQKNTVISYLKHILIEEQVQCLICMNKYRKPGVTKMFMCQHQYCKLCLKEFYKAKLTNFSLPKCPSQQCNAQINKQNGFFKVLIPKTKQLFDKVQKFYFTSNDPFLKMCPSQNCQGLIPIIQNEPFKCIQCQNQFCRKCMYFKHEGKCAKNQAVVLNMKYHYCKCNKCGIIVQKTQACDHMTCKCGYQFCYKCGRKWIGTHHCPPVKRTKVQNAQPVSQDHVLVKLLKLIGRIAATLAIISFIAIYAVICLLPMMLGTLILGLIVGMFFYPFKVIYDACKGQSIGLGIFFIAFFPSAIICGIYTGFKQYWGEAFLFWCELFRLAIERPLSAIWY